MPNDETLIELYRDAHRHEAAGLSPLADLAAVVRRRHRALARRRTWTAAAALVPVAGAAAVAGVLATGSGAPEPEPRGEGPGAPSGAGSAAPAPPVDPATVRLANYTVTLPASFGARTGTCEVTLNGTTRQGVPGAGGSCAAMWQADELPDWAHVDVPPPGVVRVAIAARSPEVVSLLLADTTDSGTRYVVASVAYPAGTREISIPDLESAIEAARRTPD